MASELESARLSPIHLSSTMIASGRWAFDSLIRYGFQAKAVVCVLGSHVVLPGFIQIGIGLDPPGAFR